VILNLIRNAIDAMHSAPPGAKYLRIATGLGEESLVTLRVEDTGPGISVADRDRIFEPFFTTKPTGTGLGLSICRTIIEKHGGILRLADTDTRGSSFEMTFTTASTAEHFA
jgi:signal transduction histidine kinase